MKKYILMYAMINGEKRYVMTIDPGDHVDWSSNRAVALRINARGKDYYRAAVKETCDIDIQFEDTW